jgi:hypothetical protein
VSRRPIAVVLLFYAEIWVAACTASGAPTTPGDILANPDRFDGEVVRITGKVTNLRENVSRRGNAYYTYDLDDGLASIRIFSFGKAPCPEGSGTTLEGIFSKEKRLIGRTFYNEVEARSTKCH